MLFCKWIECLVEIIDIAKLKASLTTNNRGIERCYC